MTAERPDFPVGASAAAASATRLLAVYLLLGGLALSPLLWAAVPPLVDYPNHLARMWILAHPSAASALNYVPHWQLLPTLAMDLVVPPLAQFMPIELAGSLFIALTMALLVSGTVALHRVLWGRVGLWPLCSLLFLYNEALHFGFLNYLFGLGLSLLAFSGWIATGRCPTGRRVLAFSLASSLLFVMHLFAFGVYGLLVVSYEAGKPLRARRWTKDDAVAAGWTLAQFVVPAMMWLATLSNGGPHFMAYGRPIDKALAVMAPMAYGGVALVVIPLSLGLIYLGWRTGALTLAPAMRLPVAVLIVAAALMPNWLFGSWAADMRLPIALSFIVIAATQLRVSRRVGLALGILAISFLGVRVYALTMSWRDMDHRFGEYRAAAAALPQGARILLVEAPMPEAQFTVPGVAQMLMLRQPPDFRHMVALSVIDRGAFIPSLFTGWTTIRPTERNAGLFQSQGLPLLPEQLATTDAPAGPEGGSAANAVGEPPYWRDWPTKFDFVLWLDFGATPAVLPPRLEPWAAGSFFHIYRVKR